MKALPVLKMNRVRRAMPFKSDRPSALLTQPQTSSLIPSASTRWLLSNREIDLLLLAICSCLLTIICHPAISLLQSPIGSGTPGLTSSTTANPSQIDFLVKSGLLTSSQQQENRKQDEE